MRRLIAAASIAWFGVLGVSPLDAGATDTKEVFRFDKNGHTQTYNKPLPGRPITPQPNTNPDDLETPPPPPATPNTSRSPTGADDPTYNACLARSFCHLIRLEMFPPKPKGYIATLTLEWPKVSGNIAKLQLYVYSYDPVGERYVTEGAASAPQGTQKVTLIIPDMTSYRPPDQNPPYIGISNHLERDQTVSSYTIGGQVTEEDIYEPPGTTPRASRRPTTGPRSPFPSGFGAFPTLPPGATPTPEVVGTPGPDGPESEYGVGAVATGFRPPRSTFGRGSGWTIATIALVTLVGGGGGGLVIAKILRERPKIR